MPIAMERNLMKKARKKGYKRDSKEWDRYVYGTMNKLHMLKK